MLSETFGCRRRGAGDCTVMVYSLNFGSTSVSASCDKTKRTFRHGIAVHSVGTRTSTGIREMRVVVLDEDTDVDPDAWRGKATAYEETGGRWLLESAVRPPVYGVRHVWVEGENHCAVVGGWGRVVVPATRTGSYR